MKPALAVTILVLSAALAAAQTSSATRPSPSPAPNLDAILTEIQQATQAANTDISRLRIDRWKADFAEKAQMQQVADSLHKNITFAVPDLMNDVRSSHGSVSACFKLYHNVNVVFEYLNSLTDAAGNLGKREEYDPLNSDTAALDSARQHLSAYIEQAATSLENQARAATAAATAPAASPQPTPKKIIVDDATPRQKPVTPKKKKTSTPSPQPTSTPN